MGNGVFYMKNDDSEIFIIHNKITNKNKLTNLKNKIAQRAVDPNIYYDEILKNKKQGILNKFKDPDFLLKTTHLVESDAATLGTIIKEEIIKEKDENPDKFYDIDELIEDEDNENFAVGILAKSLENEGICTVIEKKSENINISNAILQFIINGTVYKKKFTMTYNYGEDENNKILYDEDYQNSFINYQKSFISKKLGIKEKFINICNFRKGSVKFDLIIDNSVIIDETINDINKYDDENIDPLLTLNKNFDKLVNKIKKLSIIDKNLKEISSEMLFEGIKLCPEMFDSKGNNDDSGWASDGEKRGGKEYFPPHGWIGHGLNVLNRFDGGNNKWIGMKNKPGEFPVAYHGVGRKSQPFGIAKNIIDNGFIINGGGQAYADYTDTRHPPNKCGQGAYFTPIINEAAKYAGVGEAGGKRYKLVFMCRVNRDKIREPDRGGAPRYWILNGTKEEVRPYRILIKETN